MKAKDKAQKMVNDFFKLAIKVNWNYDNEILEKIEKYNDELGENVMDYWKNLAKDSALKTVNEIIKSNEIDYLFTKEEINHMEFNSDNRWIHETFLNYWKLVKKEIKKL